MPCAGVLLASDTLAAQVASRARPGGDTSILVEAGLTGQTPDEVTVGLPSKVAARATPSSLPAGWSAVREKSAIRISGPASAAPVHLRLDVSAADVPPRVNVLVRRQGKTLSEGDVTVRRMAPLKVASTVEGLLMLPKTLYAGDRIACEILDLSRTPAGGRWTVAGQAAEETATSGRAGSTLHARISNSLRAGDPISVSYVDPWGETLVNAPGAAQCRGGAPQSAETPRLESCAPMGFTGQTVCVCGSFPNDAAREGLTLNGKPLGAPAGASSGVVFVRIPPDTPPGPARIAGLETAGFSPNDHASVTVLRLGGEIDRSKLMRSESTPMRLQVEGTSRPLAIRVRNETPGIIRLEGGNDQVATTDGRSPNGVVRTVYAVSPGDFKITYSLETDDCPCTVEKIPTPKPTMTPTEYPRSEERPTPTPVVYATYPPELRTREKSPTPLPSPTVPTPRPTTGDTTHERTYTPTPPSDITRTQERTSTPNPTLTPPSPTPPPTYSPTPTPTITPQCQVSYTVEGGPGITIDAVIGPPPPTSKRNEPIPLFVSASDMDQLLQTCACSQNGQALGATHRYIDLPDTVQYRWRKLAGAGSLASGSGPATLYKPPALKVGESDSASIEVQIVDARDNDKPASVAFTITVKRIEECKYQRTFAAVRKSDAGHKKEITDVHEAVECAPQDPAWEKEPKGIDATATAKVKVCAGERTLLTASASDTDRILLVCTGSCGSDRSKPEMDDPVRYTWSADKGGFPDYGGHSTTNSDSTSVIYQAPAKPGKDAVHLHVNDSGKEAIDKFVDKSIDVTAYKLDMAVSAHADDRAKDCDAYFICLNDDDDDKKGADDRDVSAAAEDDLVKITLKMEPEKSGVVTLSATAGADKIRVWADSKKGKEIKLPYAPPKLPMDVWVEGFRPSDKARDVELQLSSDDPHCEVRRVFTVERPDIDMDGVLHPARQNPGGFVCLNKDDDDKNGVADKDDAIATPGVEDELVSITINKWPKEGSVTVAVTAGAGRVRIWEESADHKNMKGSRAEGKSYKAEDLPRKLWLEGVAVSGAPADVEVTVTDDDSGCTSLLDVTVFEVDLKASMPVRGGGFSLVPEADEEKKGAFVGVNADDDDANGVIDRDQQPVPGEKDLLKLELTFNPILPVGSVGPFTFSGSGAGKEFQLWTGPTKTGPLDLSTGVTLTSADLPKTYWLEAVQPSASRKDLELKLSCSQPRPCDDKVRVTGVQLHLQTDLNMDQTIDQNDWKLERKPGAYIVFNDDDDDRNGKPDYLDDVVNAVAAPGYVPPAGARKEQDLKKFQIAGPLPASLTNTGKVLLRRSNGNVRVYSVAEKGVASRILWSAPPGAAGPAYAAAAELNGVKTWDLSDDTQRNEFLSVRDHLWVEGAGASAAERDTSLTVSYIPDGTAAEIEMNRIDVTVVRFDRIRAIVAPTPESPARVPPNPPVNHTFDNAAGGIVYHLNENKDDADKNFDGKHAMVLIRRANEQVPLTVTHQPAVLPLTWSVTRARDDAAALGKSVPAIEAAGGAGAKLGLDDQGSFLVFCYYDANGNGTFDDGEPRMILPLILVDAEVDSNSSATHNHISTTVTPAFIQVTSAGPGGGFDVNAPDDAAAYLAGKITVRGGGPGGHRGLEKVFAGWVQEIPVVLDCTGEYAGGHRMSRIFAWPPHPANNLYLPLPAAAPSLIAAPIIDTGRTPTPNGGGEATLTRSRKSVEAFRDLGEQWIVETVDSPGLGYSLRHPGFAPPNALTAFRFNLDFRSWLAIWTNLDEQFEPAVPAPVPAPQAFAERTYSAVLLQSWTLRGSWTLDAAGKPVAPFFGGPSANLGDSSKFHPPKRGLEESMSVRGPSAIYNLCRDATK